MSVWLCNNEDCTDSTVGKLGFRFEAEQPVCPKCGYDGRQEGQLLISPVVTMHFIYKDNAGPIKTPMGNRRVACDPDNRRHPTFITNEPSLVSCEACRASEAFKSRDAGGKPTVASKPPEAGTKLVSVAE